MRASFSTPWPMTRQLQWAQVGARAWMAHSKLSNVCEEPRIVTWKAWPAGPLHEDAPERGRELDPIRFVATPTRRLGLMRLSRFGRHLQFRKIYPVASVAYCCN